MKSRNLAVKSFISLAPDTSTESILAIAVLAKNFANVHEPKRLYLQHFIFYVTFQWAQKARMFVSGSFLAYPRPRACPRVEHLKGPLLVHGLAIHTNIRLG
jgi:hypothetical protein